MWINAPTQNKDIIVRFPDGFEMSYIDVWNLGKPDENKHSELCDELIKNHGIPKAFFKTIGE